MLRGLYTATAGMISLQRRHDTITNNIANIHTPGFKQGETVQRTFPEMLISRIDQLNASAPGSNRRQAIGPLANGVLAEETVFNFAQGDILETGNPYHIALWEDNVPLNPDTGQRPHAFFTVQTPDGIRYTRNGEWTVDVNNTLVTSEGFLVLDDAGQPITITDPNAFFVGTDGTVGLNGPDGIDVIAQLGIVSVDDVDLLVRQGNGVYEWTGDGELPPMDGNVELYQGYTERSNVNLQQATVDLMQVMRLYEANQRTIQAYDRSLEKAVNEVGRLG